MLGAIIGDIVGSRFEFNNHRSKEFELFGHGCKATDDSIMTLAVAMSIMEASRPNANGFYEYDYGHLSELAVKYMREIGRKYPGRGYGGAFSVWVFSDAPKPYNSFGNGAAMRVSPAGFAAISELEAWLLAEAVTKVTHNHKEGIKGAEATASAVFMARRGALKSEIRKHIELYGYKLDFKIDDIRATYQFNETCQETVPQAIECFLESASFEDAIRTAISLGGDSDTIAAITGAIAEAYYGVPDDIKAKALGYLDDELRAIYDAWDAFAPSDGERFKVLTKYIGNISTAESLVDDYTGTYCDMFIDCLREVYQFLETYPTEWMKVSLEEIYEKNDLKFDGGEVSGLKAISMINPHSLDTQSVFRMITHANDVERVCEGAWEVLHEYGSFTGWLKRLKDIDWQRFERQVTNIEFGIGGRPVVYSDYSLSFNVDGAKLSRKWSFFGDNRINEETTYSKQEADAIKERFAAIHTEYWKASYYCSMLDGMSWELKVCYSDGYSLGYKGSNAYPENWQELLDFFRI
jgi:ADP-ribosylglycohydrolase